MSCRLYHSGRLRTHLFYPILTSFCFFFKAKVCIIPQPSNAIVNFFLHFINKKVNYYKACILVKIQLSLRLN